MRDQRPLSKILYDRSSAPPLPPAAGPSPSTAVQEYFARVYGKAASYSRYQERQDGSAFRPLGLEQPAQGTEQVIPGFESVQKMPEPETRRRIVNDPMTELPGLTDDPCPWEWVADGVYFNLATRETFEWSGQGAGILTTSEVVK